MNISGNDLKLGGLSNDFSFGMDNKVGGGMGTQKAGDFKNILGGLIDEVDTLQKSADASIQGLVSGETKNIHDVTIKMEEAGVAFELMMEIRNKLVDAYQQVVKMQP